MTRPVVRRRRQNNNNVEKRRKRSLVPKRYSCCVVAAVVLSCSTTNNPILLLAEASSPHPSSSSWSLPRRFLPGRRGFPVDDDEDANKFVGIGRELNLFGGDSDSTTTAATSATCSSSTSYNDNENTNTPRGGDTAAGGSESSPSVNPSSSVPYSLSPFQESQQQEQPSTTPTTTTTTAGRIGGSFPYNSNYSKRSSKKKRTSNKNGPNQFFRPVTDWWSSYVSPSIKNWPKIQCVVEPTTTLKIRKTFRPLKTVVRLGADFNTQLGVWQFKSSWEDEIIGGKLTLAGRELQLTKSWQLTGGGFGIEDLVTRLRLRAAVDLKTWKAYCKVGFRTERLRPINVMEGFTILKQVPLDGNRGNVKLEVKANVAIPEPEIEYSTETQRSLVGMGDIEVNIEELNLMLDY